MNSADYVVLTQGEFLPLVNRSVQVQICPVSVNHSVVDLFRASSLRLGNGSVGLLMRCRFMKQ